MRPTLQTHHQHQEWRMLMGQSKCSLPVSICREGLSCCTISTSGGGTCARARATEAALGSRNGPSSLTRTLQWRSLWVWGWRRWSSTWLTRIYFSMTWRWDTVTGCYDKRNSARNSWTEAKKKALSVCKASNHNNTALFWYGGDITILSNNSVSNGFMYGVYLLFFTIHIV